MYGANELRRFIGSFLFVQSVIFIENIFIKDKSENGALDISIYFLIFKSDHCKYFCIEKFFCYKFVGHWETG